MNGKVIKLFDIESIEIPKDMLKLEVAPDLAEDALRRLSLRYGEKISAEKAENGDTVYCRSDEETYPDKRNVLIFVGTGVPGAEKAEKDVIGKSAGETFDTELVGKNVKLTVKKIVRLIPEKITDEVITSMKIEGVNSVDLYKKYVTEKALDSQKTEKIKMANFFILSKLAENSTFEYDEAEMEEYAEKAAVEALELYSPEELDETCEELKLDYIMSKKQAWTAIAFCQSKGLEPNMSEIEEDTDRMLEMMSLMGEELPDRQELIEDSKENAYYGEFFSYIETMINEKMGG